MNKRSFVIVLAFAMSFQAATPALAQTSRTGSSLVEAFQGLSDEEAFRRLQSLTMEEKRSFLHNLEDVLATDAQKLAEAQEALRTQEKVSVGLTYAVAAGGAVGVMSVIRVLLISDNGILSSAKDLKVMNRSARLGGLALTTVVIAGGALAFQNSILELDREAAADLARKVKMQRQLVRVILDNLSE